ncbi:MAG TPA: chemotaxis protein CheA [Nevskiaceae bacterium]|nr:chemotaxis protein CheA [Nevskiaceae bacterium]
MTLDLARFHKTFFDESREGLDVMERGLLALDQHTDTEAVHTIFRAAHSIKGGAATFGFSAVASFTHRAETLLDQLREGQRQADRPLVEALLQAVDTLRMLIDAAENGADLDLAALERSTQALDALLGSAPAPAAVAAAPAAAARRGWQIGFRPHEELFACGNDPLHTLRALAELGTVEAELIESGLPAWAGLQADRCHLAWQLRLDSPAEEAAVRDCFAWVEDVAEIVLAPLGAAPPAASSASGPVAAAAAAPATEASPAPAAAPSAVAGGGPRARPAEPASLRVATDKIDALINLVGELVITQAMLAQHAMRLDPVHNEKLLAGLSQLDRNTRSLQEAVMSTRMLPVESVFSRFPRLVRDLATKLGKQVQLLTQGEQTELDKSVIEKIVDPLNHLVRNSLDHGLESPEQRRAAGKPEQGTLTLRAAHQGGHIHVDVIDDGRGLDRSRILAKAREKGIACSETMSDGEVFQLIFAPGFSTAEQVTDVSGRGVGMDVVKQNIRSLGGTVELSSRPGQGTTVSIRLPLTLAILDGMSVAVGQEIFIIPLSSVVESLQPLPEQIKPVAGQGCLLRVRDEYLPLVDLREWFGLPGIRRPPHQAIAVLVEAEGRKLALQIDELVTQQQVVIKSLETNYRRVRGVSGATILGDGRVSLILDVGSVVRLVHQAVAA